MQKNLDTQLAVIGEKVSTMHTDFSGQLSHITDLMERMIRLEEREAEQRKSLARAHKNIEILDARADKTAITLAKFAAVGFIFITVASLLSPYLILWLKSLWS